MDKRVFLMMLTDSEGFKKMMETPLRCRIKCGDLMTIVTLLCMLKGADDISVELRNELGVGLNSLEELIAELNEKLDNHIERSLS